ncbi:MAG: TlpA disulfide reductase family protein [Candidatus Margulisiibacteriota bacterium]
MRKLIALLIFLLLFSIPIRAIEKNIFPNLKLVSLNNKEVNLYSLIKDEKLIFINFFTSWCHYCQLEMPDLIKLANEYQSKNVLFLGIDYDEGLDIVKKLVNDSKINYPVYVVSNKELENKFVLDGFPTTIVINNKKRVMNKIVGYRDYNYFKEFISSPKQKFFIH